MAFREVRALSAVDWEFGTHYIISGLLEDDSVFMFNFCSSKR